MHTYIIVIPHLWVFFFHSSWLQNNYMSISTHDTLQQHHAHTAQAWLWPFTFSWEAAAFPSSLLSSISSSLHSQSPSSVLWRWPLDPGTRLTWNKTRHLAECTQHWPVLLPGLYSMPETQKINPSGYQSTDNWKVTKDHSPCRLPPSTSFQKYCVLETHEYHRQEETFWRIPYACTIKYGLQFSLILGNFISYHTHIITSQVSKLPKEMHPSTTSLLTEGRDTWVPGEPHYARGWAI